MITRVPGCLLAPFGWAAGAVADSLTRDPSLATDLLWVEHSRLHLIAMCLAHAPTNIDPHLILVAIRGRTKCVLRDMLPDSPKGLRGVLAKLASRILAAEDYRSIRLLLSRRNAGNILRHTRNIDEGLIKLLEGVPDDLCRPVMASTPADMWHRMSRFIDGLQIVARRLGVTSQDIISELTAANATPTAFRAQLEAVVERLPLPDTLPPAVLGKARRIDRPSELRRLARVWSNCLTDYIDPVQAGEVVFYCWSEDEGDTAVCQVDRAGRLGWVVSDIKGPKNSPARSQTRLGIAEAFARIDVHAAAIISPIETILLGLNARRGHVLDPNE